jgi:alkanesulfonate monooxygenase SsuD/methylene tetrahydromethanopterin reductase-like flavin-dependent oxidoreductase (luciferase family)
VKLDLFYEIQRRDAHLHGGYGQLLTETLEQARLGDSLGYDCLWMVEHHCTPEFSYSSAPEILQTAIALNTKRMRIGHSGVLSPFKVNHALRIAERAAVMDHLSGGRLELGLAKSGGKEWETFEVTGDEAAAQLKEVTRILPLAWGDAPLNWKSDTWRVENRDVSPKPLTKPHPRMWHTCSSEQSFRASGEMGVGVLGTTLFSPIEAMETLLRAHDDGLSRCDKPESEINREKAVFTFVHVNKSMKEAIASGALRSAIWYVSSAPKVYNVPRELYYDGIRGATDPRSKHSTEALAVPEVPSDDVSDPNPVVQLLKREFAGHDLSNEEIYDVLRDHDSVIIGTPKECKKKMERYRDIGVDRLMCLMQMGELTHENTMRSIRVAGEELIPYFDRN